MIIYHALDLTMTFEFEKITEASVDAAAVEYGNRLGPNHS